MKKVKIYVEKTSSDAIIPIYKHPNDAGFDLYTIEDIYIKAGETIIAKTGLKFAIPEGYEIQIRPRSGVSNKTALIIKNSPGTIDSGFRDEVGILLKHSGNGEAQNNNLFYYADISNNSLLNSAKIKEPSAFCSSDSLEKGLFHYFIPKHTRIAQGVLSEIPKAIFNEVDNVKDIGSNRGGGFGSTGLK